MRPKVKATGLQPFQRKWTELILFAVTFGERARAFSRVLQARQSINTGRTFSGEQKRIIVTDEPFATVQLATVKRGRE